MFSLGCILLEVIVLHDTGTLSHIRENRSSDPCFHANLDRVQTWCSASKPPISTRRELLLHEIKSLLSKNPDARPTATQLLTRVTGYDIAHLTKFKNSIFDECCRNEFRSREQRENEAVALRQAHQNLQEKADQVTRSRAQLQSVEAAYEAALSELKANLETERKAVEVGPAI